MPAKSAPQLFASPIQPSRLHRNSIVLVALVSVLTVGAGWITGSSHEVPVATPSALAAEEALPQAAALEPAAPAATKAEASPQDNPRYRRLSEFLAKRYRVSQAVTLDLVSIAHAAGQQVGLDPLLIIAVMAVESRFNPIAESVVGAKGLMQVMPKFHADKFRELGGEQYAVFDPETNILVGARVLKEYVARTGSLSSALQMYVGSSNSEDFTYMEKVMTEKERLRQVLHRGPAPKPDRVQTQAGELLALAGR
jgi:soluble lytic murein transglycosylase-like protein